MGPQRPEIIPDANHEQQQGGEQKLAGAHVNRDGTQIQDETGEGRNGQPDKDGDAAHERHMARMLLARIRLVGQADPDRQRAQQQNADDRGQEGSERCDESIH